MATPSRSVLRRSRKSDALPGEPVQAGLVIVQVILPSAKAEGFSGGDVFGKVIEVDRFFGDEAIVFDRGLIEFGMRFDGADFL